jgi:hypothetical protein
MLIGHRTAQLPARKLKRGMNLALDNGATAQVLDAYPAVDVPGAPIWLELSTGNTGAVDANDVFTVLR